MRSFLPKRFCHLGRSKSPRRWRLLSPKEGGDVTNPVTFKMHVAGNDLEDFTVVSSGEMLLLHKGETVGMASNAEEAKRIAAIVISTWRRAEKEMASQ